MLAAVSKRDFETCGLILLDETNKEVEIINSCPYILESEVLAELCHYYDAYDVDFILQAT